MRHALALITPILLLAPSALAQVGADHLITPGVGIGPLKVGTNIIEAKAAVGTPRATLEPRAEWLASVVGMIPDGSTAYFFYDYISTTKGRARSGGGLRVIASRDGILVWVQADYAPEFVTENGIHTGLSESQVRSIMGEPTRIVKLFGGHALVYPGLTMTVVDNPDLTGYRTVVNIGVFLPR